MSILLPMAALAGLTFVVCICFYVTRSADPAAVVLAWAYVVTRAAHSLIHLTYNRVRHRLIAYALSNVVLLALWIRLVLALARSA